MSVLFSLAGRLLRLSDIIRPARARGGNLPLLPVSGASWWQGIVEGRFPPPLKPTPGTSAWRGEYVALKIRHAGMDWLDIVALVDTETTGQYDDIRELMHLDYGPDLGRWLSEQRSRAAKASEARRTRAAQRRSAA